MVYYIFIFEDSAKDMKYADPCWVEKNIADTRHIVQPPNSTDQGS